MQITVLVDNTTLIDRYFLAEPGLSLLIEDSAARVLFDTGYSGIVLNNALAMGKDLTTLDCLVLSHKHLDHTWGLETLIRHFTQRDLEGLAVRRPTLVAHPDVFSSVSGDGLRELGCWLSQQK
ncbi:MAG: MBL fold metallo-hydrolase, partial [Desulfohalobiaceae bacterium]|nr:MBL fold metallo-hydrolase [Desulfohalobiaceae bacterium]